MEKKSIIAMVAVSFFCGLLVGSGYLSQEEQQKQEEVKVEQTTTTKKPVETSTTTTTTPWNPAGYVVVAPAEGIAMRWLEDSEFKCGYEGDWCWGMEVISRWGCPSSLYVEINMQNKNGVNIGWTNDTAQGLGAGDKAQLIFGTYDSQAETARLAEVSCY